MIYQGVISTFGDKVIGNSGIAITQCIVQGGITLVIWCVEIAGIVSLSAYDRSELQS